MSARTERYLLGAMLRAATASNETVELMLVEASALKPQDFTVPEHRVLWRHLTEMGAMQETVTMATLLQRVGEDVDERVFTALFAEPYAKSVAAFAEEILHESVCRNLSMIGNKITLAAERALRGELPAQAATADALSLVSRAAERVAGDDMLDANALVDLVQADIERFDAHKGLTGLKTGILELDRMTEGFQPELYVIAAETGVGKSVMGLHLCAQVCRQGGKPLLFSLEMRALTQAWRLVTNQSERSKVDRVDPAMGNVVRADHERAMREIRSWGIKLCDTPALTPQDVRIRGAQQKLRAGLDLIVVDHIQVLGDSVRGNKRYTPPWEMLKLQALDLREMAHALDVPVLVLAQLNPSPRTEGGKKRRPSMEQIRGGRELENAAVFVGILHSEYEVVDGRRVHTETSLLVEKNRGGHAGEIPLRFEPQWARVFTLADQSGQRVLPREEEF